MDSKDIDANIVFLANLPRYKNEKPCVVVPPAEPKPIDGINPPNVKRDVQEGIHITDVRSWKEDLSIEDHGFQVLEHTTKYPDLEEVAVCDAYREENQELLKEHLGAEKVITWGLRKRTPNKRKEGEKWDYNNPVEVEGPAMMAHCDFTWDRGQVMIEKFLGKEEMDDYLRRGYRIRICNTWRPLLPVIERQPLAICDKRSVDMDDLVACDRVLIDTIGEIYLLQHNPEQKWYWLSSQTCNEPFLFCTWDSKYPGQDRHSPHVSFHGHDVREDAPARFSVESRSIVITPPEDEDTSASESEEDEPPAPVFELPYLAETAATVKAYLESWAQRAIWVSLMI